MRRKRETLGIAGQLSEQIKWNTLAGHRSLLLFQAIRDVSGRRVVVDASKDPIRLMTLYHSDPAAVRAAWLVRDGRAVCWSSVRRLGISIDMPHSLWIRINVRIHFLIRTLPTSQRVFLRYEDFAENQDATLRDCSTSSARPITNSKEASICRPLIWWVVTPCDTRSSRWTYESTSVGSAK